MTVYGENGILVKCVYIFKLHIRQVSYNENQCIEGGNIVEGMNRGLLKLYWT